MQTPNTWHYIVACKGIHFKETDRWRPVSWPPRSPVLSPANFHREIEQGVSRVKASDLCSRGNGLESRSEHRLSWLMGHKYRNLVLHVGGWTQGWRPCCVRNMIVANPKKWKPDAIWENFVTKAMAQRGLFCQWWWFFLEPYAVLPFVLELVCPLGDKRDSKCVRLSVGSP
jgi:hypothetical protein